MKSIRLRLLLLALLPLIVLLPVLLAVTLFRWSEEFDDLLIANVASDLRIAEQYMQQIVITQESQISGLGASLDFSIAAAEGGQPLEILLAQSKDRLGLDYLVVRHIDHGPVLPPEQYVIDRAMALGTATSIEVFQAQDLAAISSGLAENAKILLIETEAAIPTEREFEDRGMVVLGATQVVVSGQEAVLIGGTLLNRNLDFIDTINDLVYPGNDTESRKIGTATLFLEDVRISTNVRLFENIRALGTRVSEVVYDTVLNDGHTWLDRAFVVNDWYISGYLPILNNQQQSIGMLYVGFLEKPFTAIKTNTYIALITAFVVVIALSIPFFLWIASGVFSPLEKMNQTMRRVEGGDLDARILNIRSKDEIGAVASHLNVLLDQVRERDHKLRDWADTLNNQVERRTDELRQANIKLEETYKQLVISEKLASIGEITAGVAHEINNPIAVIQGNIDVMRMAPEAAVTEYQTELGLVDAQIVRINAIVGKLLQFASPDEFAEQAQEVNATGVLMDSLVLVQHSLNGANIAVKRDLQKVPAVRIFRGELQQVLVNLLINAIQAMPEGGTLTLHTSAAVRDGHDGVIIRVSDTGVGISEIKVRHVFDPFFTTKLGKGTGLGLSISQSLIQRAGGLITVQSEIGIGSAFTIWLPLVHTVSEET